MNLIIKLIWLYFSFYTYLVLNDVSRMLLLCRLLVFTQSLEIITVTITQGFSVCYAAITVIKILHNIIIVIVEKKKSLIWIPTYLIITGTYLNCQVQVLENATKTKDQRETHTINTQERIRVEEMPGEHG